MKSESVMDGSQEWPIGQLAEIDVQHGDNPPVLGRDQSPVPIPRDEPTDDPGAATAEVRWAARVAENLCHWRQNRGDAQAESHRAFHFGNPCPYGVVAAVLRGQPDPRYERSEPNRCVPVAEPLTLARVFHALADVHAGAGSKSPVRMFTDAAEAAERGTQIEHRPVGDPMTHATLCTCGAPWTDDHGSAGNACVDCGFTPVTGQRCVDCGPDGAESAAERVAVGCAWPRDSAASGVASETAQNDVAGTRAPAEAVSGGSGHAERQDRALGADGDGWEQLAERARKMWLGERVLVERLRERNEAGAAQLAAALADVDVLTAEVARYRAAIEAADNAIDLAVAHAANHFGLGERSQRMVEQIARDVRAALEAGQGAQR